MKVVAIVSLGIAFLGVVCALTNLLPNSDFEGGSAYAALFSFLLAGIAFVVALISNFRKGYRSNLTIASVPVSLLPVLIIFVIDYSQRSTLRNDLSATIVYTGSHEEIVLEYTSMSLSITQNTNREEVVVVDSVRDDGRIVVSWGPTGVERQKADLYVGSQVPDGGEPVVVAVVLDDKGASFSIERD